MVSWIYLLCGVTWCSPSRSTRSDATSGSSRPTVVTGVPRVYEKLYARIMENGASAPGMQSTLFRWAVGAGIDEVPRDAARTIGGSARSASGPVGGRSSFCRRCESGLAAACGTSFPAARRWRTDIAEFFGALGLPIIEGLRPDRDRRRSHGEPARRATRRHCGQGTSGRRIADRRGRRDPRARAQRDVGLLQQAGSDR